MVLRSRVIGTRSSRASLARGPAGAAATGAGVDERAASAPSMSPLVTRPSRPVPATAERGTPDSSERRLADGMAGASVFAAAGGGAGAAAGLGVSALGAGAFGAGAEPLLPSAM